MKIALAQINPTVGDITGNCRKILDFIDQAKSRGAKVVVFPELSINGSASPFVVGKHKFRVELFSSQVKQFGKPLVYVNQVGGNDELVFDGNSVVLDAGGNVIAQAKDFEEDLLVVELAPQAGGRAC